MVGRSPLPANAHLGRDRRVELLRKRGEFPVLREQALYNLRSTLTVTKPVTSNHQTVTFSRDLDVRVDAEDFEAALRRGMEDDSGHLLSQAVRLYHGDFLNGCPVRASRP